ncbi:flagellar hook-length control protein FliK [Desulfobaculum bizertense]|uniref:Hook-length control protein FliK n=1 Tax=Desulfobaculum bizertense DSM 18034 TaxID=1121442 RepID=A0A1T4VY16_9BACT|nr:flagellar hook-length control protein FliK [Desulfobaculum bizertense]SKA69873.1 hook-length control protein FliK [Desulfobaculum bizertense DSM 18034]
MQIFPSIADKADEVFGLNSSSSAGRGWLDNAADSLVGQSLPQMTTGFEQMLQSAFGEDQGKPRQSEQVRQFEAALHDAACGLVGKAQTRPSGEQTLQALQQLAGVPNSGSLRGTGSTQGLNVVQNLKLTQEDLLELRDKLEDMGLSKKEVQAFSERVTSEAGLTWGQFMSALSSRMGAYGRNPVQLDMNETRQLQMFFQKMGFTPQQSQNLMGQLEHGQYSTVWNQLGKRLNGMQDTGLLDVTSSDLALLGKAAQLSDKGMARLKALMQGTGDAALPVKGFRTVMSQLKSELAKDAKQDDAAPKKIQENLGQILEAALSRAETNARPDSTKENFGRNQQVLADYAQREKEDAQGVRSTSFQGVAERLLGNHSPRTAGMGNTMPQNQTEGLEARLAAFQGQSQSGAENGFSGKQSGEFSQQDRGVWEEFLGKLDVKGEKSSSRTLLNDEAGRAAELATSIFGKANTGSVAMPKLAENGFASQVMRQVENGILKNTANGSKQLNLKLDTADLGKMSLVLSVKDKEVSAVIRVDSHEAGKKLTEQLALLKQNLQDQGLKVQRLEVQTQLSDNNFAQSWQGAGQHNQQQEQADQGQWKSMFRRFQSDGETLAQEMQNTMQTVISSQSGLDIIA